MVAKFGGDAERFQCQHSAAAKERRGIVRRLIEVPAIIGGDQVCQFLAVFQQVELDFWRGHAGKTIVGSLGDLAAQDMARIYHGGLAVWLRNIAEHTRRL